MRKYGNAGERGGAGGGGGEQSHLHTTPTNWPIKTLDWTIYANCAAISRHFAGWGRGRLFLVCFFPDSIDFFF